jgi:hypothetical protein
MTKTSTFLSRKGVPTDFMLSVLMEVSESESQLVGFMELDGTGFFDGLGDIHGKIYILISSSLVLTSIHDRNPVNMSGKLPKLDSQDQSHGFKEDSRIRLGR